MKTELNTESPSTNLVTEFLKTAKINWPKFTGKAKGVKQEVQLTKSDLDFLKDFMSRVISSNEYFLNVLKEEAKRSKEDNPEHSKLCYKDWTKARNEINKLATIQKKIKSLR